MAAAELAAAARQVNTLDGEFVSELQQALSSVVRLEQPTIFAVPSDDGWHREIGLVEHDLSWIESFP